MSVLCRGKTGFGLGLGFGAGSRQPFGLSLRPQGLGFLGSLRSRFWFWTVVRSTMPYEKLVAYQVARELLVVVRDAAISDSRLRDQAMRAAMSACLNIAEASGRQSAADQKRVFAIARGEASEAAATLDIAWVAGFCSTESARTGGAMARRAYALLTGLIRC